MKNKHNGVLCGQKKRNDTNIHRSTSIEVTKLCRSYKDVIREAGDGAEVWNGFYIIWEKGEDTELLQHLKSMHGNIYKKQLNKKKYMNNLYTNSVERKKRNEEKNNQS